MEDKYNLKRFIDAQSFAYKDALNEIKNGQKQSHWIWYIFPQMYGLGYSVNAQYYGIKSLNEAKAYLNNEILGSRLREICSALLELDSNDPYEVMGYIDAVKLKSSMTLFYKAGNDDIFKQVLDKFYDGELDDKTLELISK